MEKLRLTDEVFEATRDLIALHNRELQSLLAGVLADESDHQLQEARDRRDNAMTALMLHLGEHAC